MTPHFRYLGNHVGTIFDLGYTTADGTYKLTKEALAQLIVLLKKDVDDHPELGLLAITADWYQSHIHDFLKANAFRAVMSFKSSHNIDHENLTIWARENKSAANVKYGAAETMYATCSTMYNPTNESSYRCTIRTTKPTAPGYKKVRGINVWYRVEPQYVVKAKET